MGRYRIRNMDVLVGDIFADEVGDEWKVVHFNNGTYSGELHAVRLKDDKYHEFQRDGFTHNNYFYGLVRLVSPHRLPLSRREAYAAIDTEREYQDSFWPQDGQEGRPNPLTIGEFVLLAEKYLADARAIWATEKKPEGKTLDIMRKVAGIAVNCLEQHGAPKRVTAQAPASEAE